MPIRPEILALTPEIAQIRQTLHANPQLAFAETFASNLVAEKLTAWGIEHARGLAGTGIVAWVDGAQNTSGKTIGLRGDMDALPIEEEGTHAHKSCHTGCMHACGHDGHTATLLGTAKYLKDHPHFNGRVYFLFQPAEESGGGAMKMIEEGVFDTYQIDQVFAIHNAPYGPIGLFATRTGPIMACNDDVFITVHGKGGHASMPHLVRDPVLAACQLVIALQGIITQSIDPMENALLAITTIEAGHGATNVVPDTIKLSGTVRAFKPEVRDTLEKRIKDIAAGLGSAQNVTITVDYRRSYEPTINEAEATKLAVSAARAVVGEAAVFPDYSAMMGSEDFGAMLMKRPGNYMWVGQATPDDPSSPHNQGLHHPRYDFNDQIIPLVIEYFTQIVEQGLPKD